MTKPLATISHLDLYGRRNEKYDTLEKLSVQEAKWTELAPLEPYYFFVPKDFSEESDYNNGFSLNDFFHNKSSGFRSGDDTVQVSDSKESIIEVVNDLIRLTEMEYRNKYKLQDGRNHYYLGMKKDVGNMLDTNRLIKTIYRPFDIRWTYYSSKSSSFVAWPRNSTMKHFVNKNNI